jgi:hypothetical protein
MPPHCTYGRCRARTAKDRVCKNCRQSGSLFCFTHNKKENRKFGSVSKSKSPKKMIGSSVLRSGKLKLRHVSPNKRASHGHGFSSFSSLSGGKSGVVNVKTGHYHSIVPLMRTNKQFVPVQMPSSWKGQNIMFAPNPDELDMAIAMLNRAQTRKRNELIKHKSAFRHQIGAGIQKFSLPKPKSNTKKGLTNSSYKDYRAFLKLRSELSSAKKQLRHVSPNKR